MSSMENQFQSSMAESTNPSSTVQQKSTLMAYILGVPLGFTGAHHFYLGNYNLGLTYLMTLGLAGLGWIADWFRMSSLVADANRVNEIKWKWENDQIGMKDEKVLDYLTDNRKLLECYLMLVVTGLFGSHQFYLKRYGWGFAYMFTAGLGGVGYIMDWFRLPRLHQRYKETLKQKSEGVVLNDQFYRLDDCYACGITLGVLGFHRFYLKDYKWGILYLLTLGFWGIGWLLDMIRMPKMVKRANANIWQEQERRRLLAGNQGPGATYVNVPGPSRANELPAATMHAYMFPAQAPSYQNQHEQGPTQLPPPPPPYTPVADAGSALPNDDERMTSPDLTVPDSPPIEKKHTKAY